MRWADLIFRPAHFLATYAPDQAEALALSAILDRTLPVASVYDVIHGVALLQGSRISTKCTPSWNR